MVLFTTLKPNGKLCVNCEIEYGFNRLIKGIEHLKCISDLCCLDLYLFVLSFAQPSGKKQLEIKLIIVFRQELFERKPAVHFLPHDSRKEFFSRVFDPEYWWEIYLNRLN